MTVDQTVIELFTATYHWVVDDWCLAEDRTTNINDMYVHVIALTMVKKTVFYLPKTPQ